MGSYNNFMKNENSVNIFCTAGNAEKHNNFILYRQLEKSENMGNMGSDDQTIL
jgi:hypothetical protein